MVQEPRTIATAVVEIDLSELAGCIRNLNHVCVAPAGTTAVDIHRGDALRRCGRCRRVDNLLIGATVDEAEEAWVNDGIDLVALYQVRFIDLWYLSCCQSRILVGSWACGGGLATSRSRAGMVSHTFWHHSPCTVEYLICLSFPHRSF